MSSRLVPSFFRSLVRPVFRPEEEAAGADPIAAGIAEHMTLIGDWAAPLELAGSVANGGVGLVDVSGNGAPDVLSANGGAARHIIQTSSPPAGMATWLDLSQHFVTEYIGIASALATKYRCGGIVFKAHTLSPGEISLWDVGGSHASPHNLGDGVNGQGTSLMTDYNGFDAQMDPPAPYGICGTAGSGASWFLGYGSYTGWMHLQFATLAAGAATVRTRLSKIGDTWGAYYGLTSDGDHPYVDSGAACAADGISDVFQIGYAGSHDTGVLGIARVYLGSDSALDDAALEAIHALFV